jgi:flagellar protein FlaI
MASEEKGKKKLSDIIKRIKMGDSQEGGDEPPLEPVSDELVKGGADDEKADLGGFLNKIKQFDASFSSTGKNEEAAGEPDKEATVEAVEAPDEIDSLTALVVSEDEGEDAEEQTADEATEAEIPAAPEQPAEEGEPEDAHRKLSSLISKIRQFEEEGSAIEAAPSGSPEIIPPEIDPAGDAPATLVETDDQGREQEPADAVSADEPEDDLRSLIDDIVKSHDDSAVMNPEKRGAFSISPVDLTEEPAGEPEPTPSTAPEMIKNEAKHTRWSGEADEGAGRIVNVDEIGDFSDMILPSGATFEVEDLHLGTGSSAFDLMDMGTVISEIDEIWKPGFPTIPLGADELSQLSTETETAAEGAGPLGFMKKVGLFKTVLEKVEEYDPRIHGPLVDLTMKAVQGQEEVELYPVNEPFAYIRIIYDNSTHEHVYQIIEPELNEAERELIVEIEMRLFETLDVNTKDLTHEAARTALRDAVDGITHDYGIKLTPVSREKILYNIEKEFLGDGRIDPIMHDKYIEDISCDGLNTPIFVYHTGYESIQTSAAYDDSMELDSFVTKMAQRAGKYISIAEPMLDATMSDGSRIQMTLGKEVTAHGSTFTIRKFRDEPITPTDLIEWQTFSPLSIAFLWLAVENSKSCIFCGGTASGKTTSLNAISLFIPPLAKIVTLEDTRELKLPHPNWIPSITRESFDADGKGSIDMYELLRAALRQRPEYILVGEVRGQEALTLFQAMSTGHVTYATMHADSVASAVHRLENPPLNVPRNMLNALDLVSVQVQARIGGQRIRRTKQLIEILDIDPRTNELITNEVFRWHPATDEIRYSGKSYILEEIMEERGWSEARMREELKRRQEILEWMRLKKLRHFKDVAKVLISYFRDPEAVMDIVRGDLYE